MVVRLGLRADETRPILKRPLSALQFNNLSVQGVLSAEIPISE